MHWAELLHYRLRTFLGEKLKLTALAKVSTLGDLDFELQGFVNMNYSSYQIYRIFGPIFFKLWI